MAQRSGFCPSGSRSQESLRLRGTYRLVGGLQRHSRLPFQDCRSKPRPCRCESREGQAAFRLIGCLPDTGIVSTTSRSCRPRMGGALSGRNSAGRHLGDSHILSCPWRDGGPATAALRHIFPSRRRIRLPRSRPPARAIFRPARHAPCMRRSGSTASRGGSSR